MKYTYYPGCSLEATSKHYDTSTKAVCSALGIDLVELEDWNCCGASAYMSIEEHLGFALSARNLALAEKLGWDVIAPCSGCFVELNKANNYFNKYPEVKEEVQSVLKEAGLEYNGTTKVRHLLDVVYNDVGLEVIKSLVKKPLKGLRVASYYGCQIVRPRNNFDDPEDPHTLDDLVTSLGATSVYFPMKNRCCGGSLTGSMEGQVLRMVKNILLCAQQSEAQILVTTCPLCQLNLDAYQSKSEKKFGAKFHIPAIYFTQLMGLAMELPIKAMGFEKNIVSVKKALAPYVSL
jgi:heterodisulfide reductase subunit B